MSRRYAVPVRAVARQGQPHRFTWRGRAYVVQEVLGHWVSGAAWWRAEIRDDSQIRDDGRAGDDSRTGDDVQVWRVAAGRPECSTGVYDLACAGEQWWLSRVAD